LNMVLRPILVSQADMVVLMKKYNILGNDMRLTDEWFNSNQELNSCPDYNEIYCRVQTIGLDETHTLIASTLIFHLNKMGVKKIRQAHLRAIIEMLIYNMNCNKKLDYVT